MATSLLQFNPSTVNQETDAEYLADSQRAGGFGVDNIVPSALLNKMSNQWGNYLFALFTAFANKGFATDDANITTLIAQCSNFLTSADVLPNLVISAYSPTPVFNAGTANGFQMALAGNVTSSSITGVSPGQLVAFIFVQNSTGGWTVSWPSSMTGTVQPDPAPNSTSLILFRADLSGVLHAAGPLVSNNGAFFPAAVTVAGTGTFGSLTLASPGSAGQVLTNVGGLFVPQTPTAVASAVQTNYSSGGRSYGVTYTNTDPLRTLIVDVTFGVAAGSSATVSSYLNGSIYRSGSGNAHGLGSTFTTSVGVVVPAGANYKFNYDIVVGIDAWWETLL